MFFTIFDLSSLSVRETKSGLIKHLKLLWSAIPR